MPQKFSHLYDEYIMDTLVGTCEVASEKEMVSRKINYPEQKLYHVTLTFDDNTLKTDYVSDVEPNIKHVMLNIVTVVSAGDYDTFAKFCKGLSRDIDSVNDFKMYLCTQLLCTNLFRLVGKNLFEKLKCCQVDFA